MRGSYAATVVATGAGQVAREGVPFEFALASKPAVHLIAEGGKPTTECPGSVAAPEAQSGNLFVYEHTTKASTTQIFDPTTGLEGSSQFGWYARIESTGAGESL